MSCGPLRARLGEKEGRRASAPVGSAGSRCLLRLDINLGNSGCARVELVVGSLRPAFADATGNECECCRRCGWNERSDWLTRAAGKCRGSPYLRRSGERRSPRFVPPGPGVGWGVPAMREPVGGLSHRSDAFKVFPCAVWSKCCCPAVAWELHAVGRRIWRNGLLVGAGLDGSVEAAPAPSASESGRERRSEPLRRTLIVHLLCCCFT